MKNNYKMIIAYDGTRYYGWEHQPNTDMTIQGKLESVLSQMTGEQIDVIGAGRTDAGVHAWGQVANFKTNSNIPIEKIAIALNSNLKKSIRIKKAEEVDERFHSQLNAREKTYVYKIDMANVANVFTRKYAYHTFDIPDIKAMKQAAFYMIGKHDFKAFTTAKKSKSTVREVEDVEITTDGDSCEIRITADDFLHNMARYMIGMLLDVGSIVTQV